MQNVTLIAWSRANGVKNWFVFVMMTMTDRGSRFEKGQQYILFVLSNGQYINALDSIRWICFTIL